MTGGYAFRRRLAALLALLAAAAGTVSLARGFLQSPVAVLISIVAMLASIGAGWVALTRYGPTRRRAAAAAALLVMVAIIAALIARSEEWSILLGIIAVAFAWPLGRYAIGRDRRALADLPAPGEPVSRAERPILLVNPRSGDGAAERADLRARARDLGIPYREFHTPHDVRQLAEQAVADGVDVIGVAGGDGSLAVVADVVSRAGRAMVVVPAGTRNHFAMDLGLDRQDPAAALEAFGPASQRVVDLARVNGRIFLNNVSMGLYGEVVQQSTYRERKIATAVQELPDLVSQPPNLRFTGPDGGQRSTVHIVHVSNNPYLLDVRGAGGRPRLDSGELGVVTAELGSAAMVAEMFARVAVGRLSGAPGLESWTTTQFVVESDGPIAAGLDGEAIELAERALFEIAPAALRVRIPPTAIGHSPAAFVPEVRHALAELLRRAFLPTSHWRPLPRR